MRLLIYRNFRGESLRDYLNLYLQNYEHISNVLFWEFLDSNYIIFNNWCFQLEKNSNIRHEPRFSEKLVLSELRNNENFPPFLSPYISVLRLLSLQWATLGRAESKDQGLRTGLRRPFGSGLSWQQKGSVWKGMKDSRESLLTLHRRHLQVSKTHSKGRLYNRQQCSELETTPWTSSWWRE